MECIFSCKRDWVKKSGEIYYAIWYVFYNLKNIKNTYGVVLACNFTKSNIPPWVLFTFLKLFKW